MDRLSWYNTDEISTQCLRALPNRDGILKNDIFIEAVHCILGLPSHILQPLCSIEDFLYDIVLLYEVQSYQHQNALDLFSRFIVDVKLSYTLRDASKEDVIVSTINDIKKREGVTVVSTIHEIPIDEYKSDVSKNASPNDGIALLAATASRFLL